MTSLFQNRSSRRKEALISLKYEPRDLGCYEVLKSPLTLRLLLAALVGVLAEGNLGFALTPRDHESAGGASVPASRTRDWSGDIPVAAGQSLGDKNVAPPEVCGASASRTSDDPLAPARQEPRSIQVEKELRNSGIDGLSILGSFPQFRLSSFPLPLGQELAREDARPTESRVASSTPASASTNLPGDAPLFELRAGEKFFRVNHQPAFVFGRNPVGMSPKAYDDHFRQAAEAGERFMRIHFTFIPPHEKAGDIDAGMLKSWDMILDAAEKHGLAVLPVLGVWADWNDGSKMETWHTWDKNPFNLVRGGPAQRPSELFEDTPCRRLWLQRLETFVRRWSHRRAIVGWEIFSELDLVTGATEERAVEFTGCAAAVIRAADPWKRPITASQAGVNEWPKLLRSPALDFIEIHPYADGAFGGRLDELIISTVRERLKHYGKPVLLGECGLSSAPPRGTLETAARADIGIRHALWAAMVSGAMNGRALWWQDGYDQFEKADLCRHYQQAAVPAAALVRGVDYTGFGPVPCVLSDGLKGAMIGSDQTRLGWFRDVRCVPPAWPMPPVSGQTVMLEAPGKAWQMDFFDPITGKSVGQNRLMVHDGKIRIVLPEFQGSVAIRLKRLAP